MTSWYWHTRYKLALPNQLQVASAWSITRRGWITKWAKFTTSSRILEVFRPDEMEDGGHREGGPPKSSGCRGGDRYSLLKRDTWSQYNKQEVTSYEINRSKECDNWKLNLISRDFGYFFLFHWLYFSKTRAALMQARKPYVRQEGNGLGALGSQGYQGISYDIIRSDEAMLPLLRMVWRTWFSISYITKK